MAPAMLRPEPHTAITRSFACGGGVTTRVGAVTVRAILLSRGARDRPAQPLPRRAVELREVPAVRGCAGDQSHCAGADGEGGGAPDAASGPEPGEAAAGGPPCPVQGASRPDAGDGY